MSEDRYAQVSAAIDRIAQRLLGEYVAEAHLEARFSGQAIYRVGPDGQARRVPPEEFYVSPEPDEAQPAPPET